MTQNPFTPTRLQPYTEAYHHINQGKHCNQQTLWIHSVYVAALLGSHGPAPQTTPVWHTQTELSQE
jgi:hypothetical protein